MSAKNVLKDIARRVMIERGLQPEFSAAALAETEKIASTNHNLDRSIQDLRGLLWASIDNDDSRDLDQLSVAEALPDGKTKILVAIADVDSLVKKGSAIDQHARTNTTSVYTAGMVFSMLPETLSTNLSSLGEGQDRESVVVEMVIDTNGAVTSSNVYRAIVMNRAQLAYNAVAAWLDDKGPQPAKISKNPGLDEVLRIQDKVAQAMKGMRRQHGALSLETIEARAVFEGEAISDLNVEEKNRAKELIEEFMVAANGVTAQYLAQKGFPSLRRILRSPDRWARIVDLASASGGTLPTEPNAAALDDFLTKRRHEDPQTFPDLSLAVVKLLGSGEYDLEMPGQTSQGHFGLAVKDYTHSTAPNRRFPDLLTQRLLKAAMGGRPLPYTIPELTELARHCTVQEDNATKVERHVRKSSAALFLERRIGESFDGIITGASEKGTWVRIFHPPAEGRVISGFQGLDVGDRARVKLLQTNVARGFIDFVCVKEKSH